MNATNQRIIEAIETAPLNRGLKGNDWLAFPGNIPVTFDNGDVALFDNEGEGTYQVHFLFVSRGREAIAHAREAGGKSAGMRPTRNGPCELFVLSKFMWKVANQ
jgi:hypothetical protein